MCTVNIFVAKSGHYFRRKVVAKLPVCFGDIGLAGNFWNQKCS